MAKQSKKAKKSGFEPTTCFHAQNGDSHLVGVKALRVMLLKDGNNWFAQGLEIDYAAAGADLDDVKNRFAEGLAMTIGEHLIMHGTIEKLLKPAPEDAWKEFYEATADTIKAEFSTLLAHQIVKRVQEITASTDAPVENSVFPFEEIQFIGTEPSCVPA